MKKNIIITLGVVGLGCVFSANTLAGINGNPRQKLCVKLLERASETLVIETFQSVYDTNNGGTEETLSENITIQAGSPAAEYCGHDIIEGKINGDGKMKAEFNVLVNGEGNTIDEFKSDSFFNGHGQNNEWDLNEKGQCNGSSQQNPGVYMDATDKNGHSFKDCGSHEIPDENLVKIVFTPNLSSISGPDNPDSPDNPNGYEEYDPEAVINETSDYHDGQIVFQPKNTLTYQCKWEEWCNDDPSFYEPGYGLQWQEAWNEYTEPED